MLTALLDQAPALQELGVGLMCLSSDACAERTWAVKSLQIHRPWGARLNDLALLPKPVSGCMCIALVPVLHILVEEDEGRTAHKD